VAGYSDYFCDLNEDLQAERIKEIDWDYVKSDVEPLLENQDDLKILTKQTLLKLPS
jgi:hypothetical protein